MNYILNLIASFIKATSTQATKTGNSTTGTIEITSKIFIKYFNDERNRPCAHLIQRTPRGEKQEKFLKRYFFVSVDRRTEWINGQVEMFQSSIRSAKQHNTEKKEAVKEALENSKVSIGSIFRWSWGYEQTNIDFFEVVKMSGSMVTVRQLEQNKTETEWLQGTCTPIPGKYKDGKEGREIKKRLQVHRNGDFYLSQEYGYCDIWDGKPEHWTAYA